MRSDDGPESRDQSGVDPPKGLAGIIPERQTDLEQIEIPQLQLPKGGGALRGIDEKFAVNASNGTAFLTVRLPFTPNREAYTPKIDLSYSSGGGNGPFGMGWSLGLSSIQRKTDRGLPRYLAAPDEDVFVIVGAEDLVPELEEHAPGDWRPVEGVSDGYRVRRYRPRVAGDFARIERIAHAAHGEYWKVTDRTNTVTIYGRSPAARIADPQDPGRIFRWLPEFSYDNKGNWIAYSYKAENADNMPATAAEANRLNGTAPFTNAYPKRIAYGNHAPYHPDPARPFDPPPPADPAFHFEVVFDYGEHDPAIPGPAETPGLSWDYRADAFSSFRAGFEIRTARLCRRVLMFHHFPDEALGSGVLVRSLDITYTPATVNGFGQASATHLTALEQAGYIRRANGSYARKAVPPLGFDYQQAEWDMTVRVAGREDLVDAPIGLFPPYQFVDLYGEGIAGILTESGNAWIYKHNRGDRAGTGQLSFERGHILSARPNLSGLNASEVTIEDLDASGEKQLVVHGPQGGGYFALGPDEAWEGFRPFEQETNLDLRDPSIRRIDLAGDGKLGILIAEDEAFLWRASQGRRGFKAAERVLKALNEEQGPTVVFSESRQSVFLADMNGDGLADIVRIRNGEICYWPNMGFGRFGAKVAMSGAPVFDTPDRFDPTKLRLADISGTGEADLVYLGGDAVRAWLNQAGNGWSAPVVLDGIPPLGPAENLQVADLFGRGTACLAWSSSLPGQAPLRYVDLMGGRKPHLLTRYINNMGKETALEYRASTHFYLADKEAGTPWVTRMPFPVHVVARETITEHVTGARRSSTYTYHHGYWDPEEREFRGFGRVDRRDSEDYETWRLNAAGTNLEQSRELFQAPTLTRTWYHVGAWDRQERILTQFEDEYWQSAYRRAFPAAPPATTEPALPDGRIVAAPTIADAQFLDRLSAEERREALRACKSLVLRQEVFGLDAPRMGASAAALQRQMIPYVVDTHTCHVQVLQPRGPNPHAVFAVAEDEALRMTYERRLDDPRIEHALNLEIDELGNVLRKANIAYGRAPARAAAAADVFAAEATDFSGLEEAAQLQGAFADALSRAEAVQTRTRILISRNRYTNDVDLPDAWRTRVPSSVETFEISGLFPADRLFTVGELAHVLDDPATLEVPFEGLSGGGVSRRLIEHQRTLYYDEAVSGPLPLHQQSSHGLIYQGQVGAFTPSLLAALYGARVADPAADLPPGGYVFADAMWWIPTGTARYRRPGETLAHVRQRFYRPVAYIDPFGSETQVRYHKDYFLFIEETTDAAGNRVRVEAHDFRLLSPLVIRDANDNLSAIVSDELALVKAQAFLGKDLDGDGVAEREVSDDLSGIPAESAAEAALVQAVATGSDSLAIEGAARQLLAHATMRFAYDLDAWRTRGEPAVAVTIVRERHHVADPNSPIHLTYQYTDGSGALAMTKTQAEPGMARQVVAGAAGAVSIVDTDTAAMAPPRLRWVGTGRLVLNNKGNPVRRYEPYFSVTPAYETLPELVATGVSAVMTYDAPGRLIRTDLPDGTFMRTEFDAWQTTAYDPGDTVLDSRWHGERVGRLIDAELLAQGRDPATEEDAARQAEIYANTPTTLLFDSLARPILSLEHAGFDAGGKALLFATTVVLDVEGNVREVIDARGNSPIAYRYDLAGRRLVQTAMDGGSRWMLPTVTGKPLIKWDQRGHTLLFAYDAMQRPLQERLRGGDGPLALDVIVMRAAYGEGVANDRQRGLRGKLFRRWDTGGMAEWTAYDGKDNPLETARRFAIDYRNVVDWSGDPFAPLEAETHVTRHSYDALNRVTETTGPDGSRIVRRYNPGNLLETVEATPAGGAMQQIVTDIAYDARGQRQAIGYGNGARTSYRYDPLNFRLTGLSTVKGNGALAQDLSYTHDCAGNLTHQEDRAIPAVFFANAKIAALNRYGYDPLYRLVSAQGREHAGQQANGDFGGSDNWNDGPYRVQHQPGDAMAWRAYSQSFLYDPVGNIRRLVHTAPGGGYTRTYAYEGATNRLVSTSIGARTYVYDHHPAHGFIRQMPHLAVMAFGFRDELVATARQSVAAGTPETTYYVYDHDGLRIRKVTDSAAGAGAQPARKEERLYLPGVEIYRSHAGATAGLERRTVSVTDERERVALIESRNGVNDGTPAEVTRYQLSNHLGSSVMELDALGQTLSHEEYHPYGTTAYQAMGAVLVVAVRRYRYSGMERDEESGLSHHNARYYCPWLARWTKPDPAALRDGINDYQYVSGNPIRLADPSGRDGWDRFLGGVKMVGGALETVAGGALVVAGVATSEFGVGVALIAAGGVVTAHGADVTVSGARTMWNGEQVDTLTSQGLQHAGMSRSAANLTDAGISIVGSLGASAITRAPTVAASVAGSADEAATAAPTVARAVTGGADEAASSVTLAFKPGLPTGHNMVGVTTEGTTTWSHLVVGSLDEVSGGMSRVASPGTNATVVASRGGPASGYLTVTVPVTQAQAQAARAFTVAAEAGGGNAGLYSYLGNNCTTYATSVLREAGVVAPSLSTPSTAFAVTALQSPQVVTPIAQASAGLAAVTAVGSQVTSEPEVSISIEPPVSEAPILFSEEPAASYSSQPEQTYATDESEYGVCVAEGYYDTEEQVCYAH